MSLYYTDPIITNNSHVGIFWDIENCGIPSNISILDAIENIMKHKILQTCKTIKFSIYGDERYFNFIDIIEFNNKTNKEYIKSAYYRYLHMINCDIEINKVYSKDSFGKRKADEADKKILVDMCLFAFDQQIIDNNTACIIVLISSDIDFAYSLEKLRERNCFTLLIHGKSASEHITTIACSCADWYSLVRGFKLQDSQPLIIQEENDKNWLLEIEEAIDSLIEDKLVINDRTLRAKLRLDGKIREDIWQQIRKDKEITKIITKAQQDTKKLQFYNPANATWDNFTIEQLKILYDVLKKNTGIKKNGKYPMSLEIKSHLKNIQTKNQISTGLVMEFVELAIKHNWITQHGRIVTIQQLVLKDFPIDEIFNNKPSIPPPIINPKQSKKIPLNTAKAALQYYFQKEFKTLPTYECERSGPDHMPEFQTTVKVLLPENKFTKNYFFAQGKSSNKKDSAKVAALNACSMITEKYLPNFKFPNNYY